MENNEEQLNPETVNQIFRLAWKSENAKANKDALQLSCEFLRLFIAEAVHRASDEQDIMTSASGNNALRTLDVEHLERILPQLLLDF